MKTEFFTRDEESLKEALRILGYCLLEDKPPTQEWRHHEFHLFIRKSKKLMLSLHEDMPSHLPPFHKARQEGKTLEAELNKIVEAYKRQRRVKGGR